VLAEDLGRLLTRLMSRGPDPEGAGLGLRRGPRNDLHCAPFPL
jgi:hypothetical protein